MLQKVRRILAAIFFVLLTLMLLDFTGVLYKLLGWMAKVQFLPAVLALNVSSALCAPLHKNSRPKAYAIVGSHFHVAK